MARTICVAPLRLLRMFRHRVGRRGAYLGFLALLDYSFAFQFWALPSPDLLLPKHVWSIAWLAAAVACTVGIFLRRDRIPYTAASFIKTAFAATFGYEWLVNGQPYGWVNTLFWFVFALVVLMVASWPDPVFTELVKGDRDS